MYFTSNELLKLRLLAEGVSVQPCALAEWTERFDGGPLTLAEYATTSGIALVLPGDLYVNAPLASDAVTQLRFDGTVFFVAEGAAETPVHVIPVPGFHADTQVDLLDGQSRPHSAYGVTHTDRCRVSPIAGCAWKCDFCDLPFEFTYRKRHAENLLNVIRVAQVDSLVPARHALVSGGTPRRGKLGSSDEEWLDDVYAYVAARSPLPVDVMMSPRRDLSHPDWLSGTGVNTVSINMEISDHERARVLTPAKSLLGRDHYLAYIERAVESFGVGRVQSLIVFGAAIEPVGSTLGGVRDLVERGCIPVLSPFRPSPVTPLAGAPGATLAEMLEVYRQALNICEDVGNGVRPGPRCVPCHHNTVTLPDESDFYVGMGAGVVEQCAAF